MPTKPLLVLSASLLAGVALVGCGGSGSGGSAADGATTTAPLAATTLAPAPAGAATTGAATTGAPATVAPTTAPSPSGAATTVPAGSTGGGGRTSCSSVVHVGDSTSVGLNSPSFIADSALRIGGQYTRVGVANPHLEISGARSIVETLPGQVNAADTVAKLKAAGYQGCWVFALGTTDTANVAVGSNTTRAERIDKMMTLVAGDPVLWVDVKTLVASGAWSNPHMLEWNQALDAALAKYPNLKIYDWASVVQNEWFSNDKIHYTSAGYTARAKLIADALATAYPS